MLRIGTLALALIASTAAQERRPLLGTVVDGDGHAIANAEVQLAYVPLGSESEPALDHPTAVTDARGRFRVDVLPCVRYQLWAIGPATTSGRCVSDVVMAAAGQLVEVRAATVQPPRTMTIKGLDKWSELGPFTVRCLVNAIELPGQSLPIGTDGQVSLPATPPGQLCVDLIDAHGAAFTTLYLQTKDETLFADVPPPQELPMRTLGDTGAPIANAKIEQRLQTVWVPGDGLGPGRPSRCRWRELGTTDAEGRLQAHIPNGADPLHAAGYQGLFFVARKEGHALSYSGFTDHPFLDGKEVDAKDLKELRFTLAPAKPYRAQVLLAADLPLAGQRAFVQAMCPVHDLRGNGWANEWLLWHATTDAEGHLVVSDLPSMATDIVVGLEASGTTLRMPPELLRESPPRPLVPRRLRGWSAAEDKFDLVRNHTLRLRVLDANKGPARGADVLILRSDGSDDCDAWTYQAAPDSAGRLTVRLEPGRWLIFVRDATSMAYQDFDCQADKELTLDLQPMPAMRGRVIDGTGQPVVDARLDCQSMSMTGGRTAPITRIAQTMNWNWIGMTRVEADGSFVARYLPLPNTTYGAVFRSGDRQSAKFQLEADGEPVTIKIE